MPAGASPIVEKSVFPRRKVCGEFISAATLALICEAWHRRAVSRTPPARTCAASASSLANRFSMHQCQGPRREMSGAARWAASILMRCCLQRQPMRARKLPAVEGHKPHPQREVWTCVIEDGDETRELSARDRNRCDRLLGTFAHVGSNRDPASRRRSSGLQGAFHRRAVLPTTSCRFSFFPAAMAAWSIATVAV